MIWTRNLMIVLPTLQPRHCQQLSTWYHRTTLLPDLHLQLQGKRTQLTSTTAPDITTATGRTFITDQSSKQRRFLNDAGLHLCVFPRNLIPQCRSRIHYDHCSVNGTTILTHGWLPLSLNLGWCRYHTPPNPASQDTGDELLTLGVSNIAIVSTYCDTPAGQPRPYVSASLRFQVFRLHRPDHAFRSTPTLPRMLQHLRNNLCGGVVWQPRTRRWTRHIQNVAGSRDARSKNEATRLWDSSIRRVQFGVRCVPTNNQCIKLQTICKCGGGICPSIPPSHNIIWMPVIFCYVEWCSECVLQLIFC
jgi:hypothetical protein